MREPPGLRYIPIDVLNDFVTNIDKKEISKNYAIEIRGFRNSKANIVGERDFGTKHTLPNYPAVLGGIWNIVNFTTLVIPTLNTEYYILIGVDSYGKTRIFVKDTAITDIGSVNNWIELTRTVKAVVSDGSIGASDETVTIGSITDINGVNIVLAIDELKYWFVKNITKGNVAFIISSTANSITACVILGSNGAKWANGDVLEIYKTTALFDFQYNNGINPHFRFDQIEEQNKVNIYYGDSNNPPGRRRPIQAKRFNQTKNYFYNNNNPLVALPERWILESYGGLVKDFVKNGDATDPIAGYSYVNIGGNSNHRNFIVNDFIFTADLLKLSRNSLSILASNELPEVYNNIVSDEEYLYTSYDNLLGNSIIFKYSYSLTLNSLYTTNRRIIHVFYHQGYLYGFIAKKTDSNNGNVNDVIIGATDTTVTISSGGLSNRNANSLIGYTVYNTSNNTQAIITSNTAFDGFGNGDITLNTIIGSNNLNWSDNDNLTIEKIDPAEIRKIDPATMTLVSSFLFPVTYAFPIDAISYKDNILIAFNDSPNWKIVEFNPNTMSLGIFSHTTTQLDQPSPTYAIFSRMFYRNEGGNDILFYSFGFSLSIKKINIQSLVESTYYSTSGSYIVTDFVLDDDKMYICLNDAPTSSIIEVISAPINTSGTFLKKWDFELPIFNNFIKINFDNKYIYIVGLVDVNLPSFYGIIIKVKKDADVLQYPLKSTKIINDWLKVDISVKSDTMSLKGIVKGYITVLYDGYQESDPVYQFYANPASATQTPIVSYIISINPATLPKNVSGFRFYAAAIEGDGVTIPNFSEIIENPADYFLMYEVLLNEQNDGFKDNNWKLVNTDLYCMQFNTDHYTNISVDGVAERQSNSATNLYYNINHAPDFERSYITPLYTGQAGRTQGSIIVVDENESTLRLSSYSGEEVHNDDNFPNVTKDAAFQVQKINLLRSGIILGIEVMKGVIYIFRANELEMYDLQTRTQNIIPIDCISKLSIVNTPYGIVFAGNMAIYLIPASGGSIIILNPLWKNYYDGSYYTTGTTSYIVEQYRREIVCGYDYLYQELWVHSKVNTASGGTEYLCFRYSFLNKKWFQRQLNIGTVQNSAPVVAFRNTNANELLIAHNTGNAILKYPYRESAICYEDDVSYNNVSAGHPVPILMRINIGEIYSLIKSNILWSITIDSTAITSGVGDRYFTVKLFSNGYANPYTTMGIPIGASVRSSPRPLSPIGQIESLELLIEYINSGLNQLLSVQNFEINRIELGFIPKQRIGNI